MKNITKEFIVSALKNAAAKENLLRARNKHSSYQLRNLKDIHYRNIAGKFHVRACEFTNYSNKYFFDPINLHAASYGWWDMLRLVNGKLIWNSCNYSCQTAKHQSQLSRQLDLLGIKPDLIVDTKANIRSMSEIQWAYEKKLAELIVKRENCQKKSLEYYDCQIKQTVELMDSLQTAKVGVRFTLKGLQEALAKARENRVKDLSWKRERKLRSQGFTTTQAKVSAQTVAAPSHLTLVKS